MVHDLKSWKMMTLRVNVPMRSRIEWEGLLTDMLIDIGTWLGRLESLGWEHEISFKLENPADVADRYIDALKGKMEESAL